VLKLPVFLRKAQRALSKVPLGTRALEFGIRRPRFCIGTAEQAYTQSRFRDGNQSNAYQSERETRSGARCRVRTYDPYRVKVMLYH
jgi:hypothetical protein